MKTTLFLLISLLALSIHAQQYQHSLYGFRLGQYREAAASEFGKVLMKDSFDDGYISEAFLVSPDTSVYMAFDYSPQNIEVMHSIQISGTRSVDLGFGALRFGMDEAAVKKILSAPTEIIDIGEYGHRWEFANSNYSVEINPKGKLSSIKIQDKPQLYGADTLPDKLPSFDMIRKQFQSGSNREIMKLLAADMEVYRGDSVYFFLHPFQKEEDKDESGILARIRKASARLDKIDVKDHNQYEENVRVSERIAPQHVYKIAVGYGIREIALRPTAGEWRIWEIRLE